MCLGPFRPEDTNRLYYFLTPSGTMFFCRSDHFDTPTEGSTVDYFPYSDKERLEYVEVNTWVKHIEPTQS